MINWTKEKIEQLRESYFENGISVPEIAAAIGGSRSAIYAALYRFFRPEIKELAAAAAANATPVIKTDLLQRKIIRRLTRSVGDSWSDGFAAAAKKRGIPCVLLARHLIRVIEKDPALIDAILDDEHHPEPFQKTGSGSV
jgi:hypothetical protein